MNITKFQSLEVIANKHCNNWVLYDPINKRLLDKQGKPVHILAAAYYRSKPWALKAKEKLSPLIEVRQVKELKVVLSGEEVGAIYLNKHPQPVTILIEIKKCSHVKTAWQTSLNEYYIMFNGVIPDVKVAYSFLKRKFHLLAPYNNAEQVGFDELARELGKYVSDMQPKKTEDPC